MFQLISNYPRYAKVIGMGFKSGRMMSAADDALIGADKLKVPTIPYANASGSNLAAANKLESTGVRLTNRAKNLDRVSENYASFNNFNPQQSASLYGDAQNLGKTLNPYLNAAESVTKPLGRVAGAALTHPVGQMGLFMGLPLMMAGGGQPQPESYQEMGSYATSMTAPASYQDAYATSYGMPATPQLDEEQIRKARRRAEEQAALNQFYAQALTQYQG